MATVTYRYEELLAHKDSGKVSASAIEKLRCDAEAILEKPTVKVTDIKLPRPSGDIHDYVSIAPYRWPNPNTPDGLPWVGRDGVVNPDTRTGISGDAVYARINTLALGALYFPERAEAYAEYANRQIYDWFLNPETKMNPNLNYGQSVPGECDGRGAGIIEFRASYLFVNGISILEQLGFISEETLRGVKAWFVEFGDWILTSELGLRVDNIVENHSSWLSANLLAIAAFTERSALINKICRTTYQRRLAPSIAPDGSQPIELKRTKGMHYSLFNLHPLLLCSTMAEILGYDGFWAEDPERGVSLIKSAVDYLYPYVKNPETFPYQELNPTGCVRLMAEIMLMVEKRYPGQGYGERAEELYPGIASTLLVPLL